MKRALVNDPRPISAAALCVHEAPEFVGALLSYLLDEYSRVYWNVFQQPCPLTEGPGLYGHAGGVEEDVLNVPGLRARSYWWGPEEDPRSDDANWEFAGVAFTWYKHPLRGLMTNVVRSPEEWVRWFDDCLVAIYSADTF